MHNPRTHGEIELEKNLAALRDIVDAHVVAFPDDGDPEGIFENELMSLCHNPKEDRYGIKIVDQETYGPADDEKIGFIGMSLFFNSSLEVQEAKVNLEGERGGRIDKRVDKHSLKRFVAGILVQVQTELSVLSHD